MAVLTIPKIKSSDTNDTNLILTEILKELRNLKKEVELIVPQEDLSDYSHPARIKRSHQKALKQYPLSV